MSLDRIEQELRESEQRFRGFAENTRDVLWVTDPREYRLLYVSPSFERVWGRPAAEVYEDLTRFLSYIHEDDRAGIKPGWERAAHEPLVQEYRVVRPDGSIIWIRDKGFPIRDDRGELLYIAGIAEDITERVQAQAALRANDARLAADLAGMRRLHELNAKLPGAADLNAALHEILQVAVEFVETDRGYVQLLSQDGEQLEIVAQVGYPPESAFIRHFRKRGSEPAGDVVRRQSKRQIIEDLATFPPLQGTRDRELALAEDIRATCCTPMITRGGELVGVLCTQFRQPHRPNDDQLRLIDLLCWTAAEFVEHHRADSALRASEERLRLILQNITDYAIFAIDPDGFVTEWTDGARRVKGWRAEEIIGQHVSIFYPPEQVATGQVDQEIADAIQHGRSEREDWRVRKGGERFWGNEIATAMRNADGKLLGFTKISRDLTERKRMEDALRQAEERHRLIVENARDYAIFMLDPQGRVMTWNTGAERIFGFAQAEIVGRDTAIMFTPEDQASGEHQKELATAAGEGRASDDRWQMRKGGERFFASGVTTPLRDAEGMLRGFVKVTRDLTDDRRMEEQRERLFEQEKIARLEAERAMTIRDEFIAVVSHELRTPLTAILLWAKMLRAGRVRQEEVGNALQVIEASAEAQRQLIEDLLDISRMMSGKLRLDMRDTDLGPLVQAAVEAVQPMAEAKGMAVEVVLDEGIGRVRADPDRVQQVIWNLLNNAVKFTDRGGRAFVRVDRVDRRVRIEVADTGRGISPEFLPQVFERFRQAESGTTRMHGGLGLGLSISRQLVELHGGTIRATSPGEGKGATFTVELPLVDALVNPGRGGGATPGSSALPFRPTPVLRGKRVLLVEDDANTRAAIRWILAQCGTDVTDVESAALAVAAFREGLGGRRFELLISDIGMPVQDGYDLMREIRQMEKQRGEMRAVPAVALTAYARDEDRARGTAAGFQAHMSKPIDPGTLVELLADVLGRAQSSTPGASSLPPLT